LDGLFAQIDAGELELTGDGGFIPALIKTALERGLQVELTDHLGYEKGDPDAAAFPNSRNGSTPKTVATQVGDVDLHVPRDREGSFTPRLVPKGSRRLGGLDEMIISLYAGGMTVRDIAHHLARPVDQTVLTLGHPAGIPVAQGLTGDTGLGGDVTDRSTCIDPLTKSTTTFWGQRSVSVGHRGPFLSACLLGRFTPNSRRALFTYPARPVTPTSLNRTASDPTSSPPRSTAPGGPQQPPHLTLRKLAPSSSSAPSSVMAALAHSGVNLEGHRPPEGHRQEWRGQPAEVVQAAIRQHGAADKELKLRGRSARCGRGIAPATARTP
jgi:hypothetical protein